MILLKTNLKIKIMASLNSLYIKLDTLKTLVETLEKKQEKGIAFTLSINDEGNQFGQNVTAWVEQSKEQREEKKPRFYTGNGNTFWTDGKISVVKKDQQTKQEPEVIEPAEKNDLPF